MTSTTRRFISSGNGLRRSPVRSPASTCPTRMPRWKAASEAAMAVVVSPWTRTQSGESSASTGSKAAKTREATSLGVWPGRIRSRSTSTSRSKRSRTWSSMWRCWAVAQRRVSKRSGSERRRRTTGAILIASGRVPAMTRTRTLGPRGPDEQLEVAGEKGRANQRVLGLVDAADAPLRLGIARREVVDDPVVEEVLNRPAERDLVDDAEELAAEGNDLGRADRFEGRRRDDLGDGRPALPGFRGPPPEDAELLGQKAEERAGRADLGVRPLELRGADELFQQEDPAGLQRQQDLAVDVLVLREVVEAVGGEDEVVGSAWQERGVAVHDLKEPVRSHGAPLVFGLADALGAGVHPLDPRGGTDLEEVEAARAAAAAQVEAHGGRPAEILPQPLRPPQPVDQADRLVVGEDRRVIDPGMELALSLDLEVVGPVLPLRLEVTPILFVLLTQGHHYVILPSDRGFEIPMALFRTRFRLLVLAAAAATLLGGWAAAALGACGPFSDVAADAFCPFVLEIFYLGITTGTTATTYSPADNVTRLQMAAFLSRSVDGVLKRGSRRAAL